MWFPAWPVRGTCRPTLGTATLVDSSLTLLNPPYNLQNAKEKFAGWIKRSESTGIVGIVGWVEERNPTKALDSGYKKHIKQIEFTNSGKKACIRKRFASNSESSMRTNVLSMGTRDEGTHTDCRGRSPIGLWFPAHSGNGHYRWIVNCRGRTAR